MFWMRNKKIILLVGTLNQRRGKPMNSSSLFHTMSLELFIVCIKGSQVTISQDELKSLKTVFILSPILTVPV